jgi:RES domain-containing protein
VRVWRLALGSYPALDGEGARLFGGRWNSPGTPVVYAATHVALALLEQLVHVSPERLPAGLRAFAIDLPDDALVENGRSDEPDGVEAARRYGDAWAASLRSAALVVPSMIVPADDGQLANGRAQCDPQPAPRLRCRVAYDRNPFQNRPEIAASRMTYHP